MMAAQAGSIFAATNIAEKSGTKVNQGKHELDSYCFSSTRAACRFFIMMKRNIAHTKKDIQIFMLIKFGQECQVWSIYCSKMLYVNDLNYI